MLKNTSACHFWPFFGTKRWITLELKKISKIANKVLEKRQRRGSVPNFKTRALAVWKLKGKENCKNEHRDNGINFMYNLCTENQCNRATLMAFYTNFATRIFSYGFHQRIRFKRNFKKRPKSDFRQKSNFYALLTALSINFCLLLRELCSLTRCSCEAIWLNPEISPCYALHCFRLVLTTKACLRHHDFRSSRIMVAMISTLGILFSCFPPLSHLSWPPLHHTQAFTGRQFPTSPFPSLSTDEAPVAKRLAVFRVYSFLVLNI